MNIFFFVKDQKDKLCSNLSRVPILVEGTVHQGMTKFISYTIIIYHAVFISCLNNLIVTQICINIAYLI